MSELGPMHHPWERCGASRGPCPTGGTYGCICGLPLGHLGNWHQCGVEGCVSWPREGFEPGVATEPVWTQ